MKLNIKWKNKLFEVLIDDADYDLIKGYNWNIHKCTNTFYVQAYIPGSYAQYGVSKGIQMHRLLMDAPKEIQVDHKNGNGLDNRRSTNLRLITNAGNQRNCRRKNKTGFRGVFFDERIDRNPNKKFTSKIIIKGKTKHLGTFDSAEEANTFYEIAYKNQIKKEIVNNVTRQTNMPNLQMYLC